MDNKQKKKVISLPRDLVEYILLGPTGDRRQLQDSPILVDVWIAFAQDPCKAQELLITPQRDQPAGLVAAEINERIDRPDDPADIAYLQGIIAARLYFEELLQVIVPITEWWQSSHTRKNMGDYFKQQEGFQKINDVLGIVARMVAHWSAPNQNRKVDDDLSSLDRYAALAGLILWAGKNICKDSDSPEEDKVKAALAAAISKGVPAITTGLKGIFENIRQRFPEESGTPKEPLVYQVSLNREATMAVARSVPAVKADAARTLFAVNCSKIAWAVIDCGIQGNHQAFQGSDGEPRVKASFDFSNFRKIVSLDNPKILRMDPANKMRVQRLQDLWHDDLKAKKEEKLKEAEVIEKLTEIAEAAKYKRPINWDALRPFIEINIDTRPPLSDHGTHVAGIIGAKKAKKPPQEESDDNVDGMCPDIQLYDFRVLAPTIKETEFAIIAAVQYIRYLNDQNEFTTIHGANLSLAIPHNVHNYACGRTPVCVECERLVDSGVVVVAAAGNYGYQSFQIKEGFYEGYAAFSITDPGNADGVITVGATHRYKPHTYGVSFFSSRGPTGDGRLKPDLVAPGERIHAPFRGDADALIKDKWGDLDGTSMAAPHVSGAAAMLMARFAEFVGQPRRIKDILCQSATNLGRERSFQGHGMLDVLRAFQSI
jgi:serine protease AprX